MIPITPPPPENIIALHPDADKTLEIRRAVLSKQWARECSGIHKDVEVDSEKRTVTCRTCGFVLDPFDYLERWALEGDRKMEGLKTLDIQNRLLSAEHDDLKRKIENARQTLKRLGRPQLEVERHAWATARSNPSRPDLIPATSHETA